MTKLLPLGALLFLATGCATPPLRVVPVATIHNEATLEYSYGKAKPFRIESQPADIVALVPRASGDDAPAATQLASVQAQSSVGEIDVAARQESEAASTVAHALAREHHHRSTDLHAVQEDQSAHAAVRQQAVSSSGKSLTRSSSLGAADYIGSARAEAHHAHAMQRVASARTETADANASSTWATTLPAIRKWATQSSVVAGENFDYVVEVRNTSALDLEFAAVLDALDDRLLVNASDVSTTPHTKLKVALSDQRLRIEFKDGIRRGRTVKIIIPAVLKMEIAEQDKSSVRGKPRR